MAQLCKTQLASPTPWLCCLNPLLICRTGGGNRLNYIGSIYTIVGDTVAFYCQWDPVNPSCTADSDGAANQWITDCCGWYGGGNYNGWEPLTDFYILSYTYGYTTYEHGWCR
jgi:hypothetical protein